MTKENLYFIMCGETILMLSCSFILGVLQIFNKIEGFKNTPDSNIVNGLLMINTQDIIYIYIGMLILSVFINIPILIKILKLQPSEIIRGVD